ncbi:30S ribosomal protein S12 methylthiotransferase RimO [Gephyromycinifex aptenodytis]|uniref:30S ribosomal protein S12 methylthiotransferase RimO n=1 Tax=Gephyromycinifex aptenodytis TaxID=2716227 RepID=UPI001D024107|nr:30S ribosomal protein S12 methylthiotransferase RimO [Gephyromycinifex aptenodytis]
MMGEDGKTHGSVAVVTLGCARNDVDSEELAGRLREGGWTLVEDPADADVALVNTCGFVEQAKKDSIDALLETADLKDSGKTQKVVAVGCLAERYGEQLAAELPEADAVLGFDSYTDMSEHLRSILAGGAPASHAPRDRRTLLPLSPVERQAASASVSVPGHSNQPDGFAPRARLGSAPWAPLKIASGCDRRCAFCAIPAFRGSFVSRRPTEVIAEARWLAEQGVREVFLVSENSTSYGKDLGDLRLLEALLPELSAIEGIERVRVSYLQPAETRPGLLEAIAGTPGVVPYFDMSFQHASPTLLRAMRRFGSPEDFLSLIDRIRDLAPQAGIRSNVIVGFPGESEEDVDILADFLTRAQLDVVGVFGYSDEDGTEAASAGHKLDEDVIEQRRERIADLVEELMTQRALERIGEQVQVLVEGVEEGEEGPISVGRAAHQGPEVDGVCLLDTYHEVGTIVTGQVVDAEGVDLHVQVDEADS